MKAVMITGAIVFALIVGVGHLGGCAKGPMPMWGEKALDNQGPDTP